MLNKTTIFFQWCTGYFVVSYKHFCTGIRKASLSHGNPHHIFVFVEHERINWNIDSLTGEQTLSKRLFGQLNRSGNAWKSFINMKSQIELFCHL